MYQVTFTQRGFLVAVLYAKAQTATEAIESAKQYFHGKYDAARAELFTQCGAVE